jgi:hypothetical protein
LPVSTPAFSMAIHLHILACIYIWLGSSHILPIKGIKFICFVSLFFYFLFFIFFGFLNIRTNTIVTIGYTHVSFLVGQMLDLGFYCIRGVLGFIVLRGFYCILGDCWGVSIVFLVFDGVCWGLLLCFGSLVGFGSCGFVVPCGFFLGFFLWAS